MAGGNPFLVTESEILNHAALAQQREKAYRVIRQYLVEAS